jgi:hypothetical protein
MVELLLSNDLKISTFGGKQEQGYGLRQKTRLLNFGMNKWRRGAEIRILCTCHKLFPGNIFF